MGRGCILFNYQRTLPIRKIIISQVFILISPQMQAQKKTNPSTNQIQQQSSVSSLPQQVIQFFECRIETEQNYAKALQKLNNKFPNIELQPTQSSKVLKHLKAIHSEKYHQTIQFLAEIKEEKNTFQSAIAKANQELQQSAQEVRMQETNLKNVMDKIGKIFAKGEQEIKNIDERFLLKELTLLGNEYRTKKIEDSLKILEQQSKLCNNLKQQYEELKNEGTKIIKRIKKHEKIIMQTSPLIERQIIQLVKKYTVQEVSLIRNLQYDIDNMIKKTNIFDEVPPPEEQQEAKHPKNAMVKIAKDVFKNDFKIRDPFEEIKKYIASLNEQAIKMLAPNKDNQAKNKQQLQAVIKYWNQSKNTQHILTKLSQKQSKQLAYQFVEYFRNKNINKFPQKQFNELVKLFEVLFVRCIEERDMVGLEKIIIYASCYCREKEGNAPNTTIMEVLGRKEFLTDAYNWKFLLYFVIQRAVIECVNVQNEKGMHLKNNVFSALVSSSLNMMSCGIDKYTTKNTVAKIAKSFGLADNQTGDLLKFIESGYDKYEKEKNKK